MPTARPPRPTLDDLIGETEPACFDVETKADGPAGSLPLDRRDAPRLALGRPLRPEPERRDGLERRPRSTATRT